MRYVHYKSEDICAFLPASIKLETLEQYRKTFDFFFRFEGDKVVGIVLAVQEDGVDISQCEAILNEFGIARVDKNTQEKLDRLLVKLVSDQPSVAKASNRVIRISLPTYTR